VSLPADSTTTPTGGRTSSLRRLVVTIVAAWRILRASAGREVALLVVLQIVGAVALALQLLLGKHLLDQLGDDSAALLRHVAATLAGLTVCTVLAAAAGAVVGERQRLLMQLVERHLEGRIIGVVVGVELEELDNPRFHDRLQRAMASYVNQPYDLVNGVVSATGAAVGIVAIGAVLLPVSPWLLPIVLLAALPLGWVSTRNSRDLYGRYRELARLDRQRAHLTEVLTTPRPAAEVRLFGAEHYLLPRYRALYDERVATVRRLSRERSARLVTVQVVVAIFGMALLAALVQLTATGRLTIAQAGLAAIAVQQLLQRLRLASSSVGSVHESSLFLGDLTSFLETPTRATSVVTASQQRKPGPLVMEHVHFIYPGTDRVVLHDLSLRVSPGEVVALVGPNGAGKSTVAKLVCGLYAPTSGGIGHPGERDLRVLERAELRSEVTAVFQDFARYALSVRDNIALADHERAGDETALRAATEQAGIAEVIEQLPFGYDTILSRAYEKGTDLSVGQWQRVALARALFRTAPFLVLDEPTAAADAASERAFLDQLRATCGERGVLLITHRLSTARRADRTYVMEAGRIVESGTHEELSGARGPYSELNRLHSGL